MKTYAQNFRKVYQFEEYGDRENYFIELAYVCARDEFHSMLGAPLVNKTASNGKPIFGNVNIDFARYKLLNERVEEIDARMQRVFETYGYAPDTVYETYSAEPVEIFGLEDPSGYLEVYADITHQTTYNPANDTFNLYLTDTSGLVIGDVIRAQFTGWNSFYNAVGPSVAIREIPSAGLVVVPAFQISFITPNGQITTTISKQDTANVISRLNPYYWDGTRLFVRDVSTRLPKTAITQIYNLISFHTSFPQPSPRFVVSLGNTETNVISSLTVPSAATWKSYIAAGTRITCQDSEVDTVFPRTFYRKTVKQILAR